MRIIGMAGPARSGKDTAADHLVNQWGFTKLGFATPLKNMIAVMLNQSVDWILDAAHKEQNIPEIGYSPRHLMQTLGTDWARNILDDQFWIRLANRQLNELYRQGFAGVVITDCRFENEAKMIRDRGGLICHISRSSTPQVREHASEIGIEFQSNDWKLANSNSIPILHKQVNQMVTAYNRLVGEKG